MAGSPGDFRPSSPGSSSPRSGGPHPVGSGRPGSAPASYSYRYVLDSIGRKAQQVAAVLLRIVLERIDAGDRLVFALDNTPTKRYGPKVQGAGIHHNPTLGPAESKVLDGHSWVTPSRVAYHARFGVIGPPLLGYVYVRKVDVPGLPAVSGISFASKLEIAAGLADHVSSTREWVSFPAIQVA